MKNTYKISLLDLQKFFQVEPTKECLPLNQTLNDNFGPSIGLFYGIFWVDKANFQPITVQLRRLKLIKTHIFGTQ